MLDLDDPANLRVVRFLAGHDQRGEPIDEAAYYPPIELLTTHPDVLDQVWKGLGGPIPGDSARFVHGVPALVHQGRGIVLAFGWGTAYALYLTDAALPEARAAGLGPVMRWSGGSETDLSLELGPSWLWGRYRSAEPGWVAASYQTLGAGS